MGRIIFWLVIAFGALLALRLVNVAKYGSRGGARSPGARPGARSRGADAAAMVRCVDCGVFLPRAEATDTPRGPSCGDARCPRAQRRTAA